MEKKKFSNKEFIQSKMSIVRNFVKDINEDYKVRYSVQFEADYYNNTVFITSKKNNELDILFNNFLEKEFGIRCNIFLISLLHEIGHLETYDEDEEEVRDVLYEILKMEHDEGESNVEEYNNMYFHIPAEYKATEWAVAYYLENKDKCDEFVERLGV